MAKLKQTAPKETIIFAMTATVSLADDPGDHGLPHHIVGHWRG
jgi:hypothetical protein